MTFLYGRARNRHSYELRRLLEDCDDNEFDNIVEDVSDSDAEDEQIEDNDFDSTSEQSADEAGEEMDIDEEDISFYIGKNVETVWCSKPVQCSAKTRAKNIVKVLPGPKANCREISSELETFLKFLTPKMIDEIVECTNSYITKKRDDVNYSRERDCLNTSKKELLESLT